MTADSMLNQALLGQGDEKTLEVRRDAIKRDAIPVLAGIGFLTVVLAGCLLLLAPELLTMGVLAYCLGLRHAVDADHIAAIDNVTRRLTTERKRPITVGFFFALGHSTVVVIVCALLALPSPRVHEAVRRAEASGGLLGATISGSFLVAIAAINFFLLRRQVQSWKEQSRYGEHEHTVAGFCMTCCPGMFTGITAPWQMYPVGIAFGLGFDTSSEVAVLAMVGLSHSLEHPVFIMLLPLMFLAGMCLIDTINGLLMAWVYGSGTDGGMQRLYYNIFLTATSAAIAFTVGTLELLGVFAQREDLHGAPWSLIVELNDNFEVVGVFIILFFLSSAAAAFCCFKFAFPGGKAPEPAREELLNYIRKGEFIDRSGV
ncbi:hoxN [Symbiodinium natans]|uniref:Nickel/cobalt efflux system n=1 Tax=Symbiodinium natans TaxID=878477 RepID=A0A812RAK4_9DINO|nr:hoxN [Symbiodinium natans]